MPNIDLANFYILRAVPTPIAAAANDAVEWWCLGLVEPPIDDVLERGLFRLLHGVAHHSIHGDAPNLTLYLTEIRNQDALGGEIPHPPTLSSMPFVGH